MFFMTIIFSFSIAAFFKSLEYKLHIDMLLKKEDIVNGYIMKNSKNLLKYQKYNYMNLFQTVYDCLQLNKRDKALMQIKWINSMSLSIIKVYRISIFSISMLLEEKIKKADNYSVQLEYNVYSKLKKSLRTVKNQNQIIEKIDEIFDILIQKLRKQNKKNIIVVDIYEYDDNITFIFKSDVLKFITEHIKNSCPYAVVEYNIIKIKFKYENPRKLYVTIAEPLNSKKKKFKTINLSDYL